VEGKKKWDVVRTVKISLTRVMPSLLSYSHGAPSLFNIKDL